MQVLKSGGQIYGAKLTSAEKKALNIEAGRTLAEYLRNNQLEIEAVVIAKLRQATGWGETRLKRFYDQFDSELDKLIGRYEMTDADAPWLCTKLLKEEGFDIEQWHREKHPNEKYDVKFTKG